MVRSRIGLAVLSFAVLAAAAPALGKDLCIFSDDVAVLALKDFRPPGADKCGLLSGFQLVNFIPNVPIPPNVLSGSACTASGDPRVVLGLTEHFPEVQFFWWIQLTPDPTTSGRWSGEAKFSVLGGNTNSISVYAAECPSPLTMP